MTGFEALGQDALGGERDGFPVSLLPPNATAVELAVEGATARVGEVGVPISTDPEIAHPSLLPALGFQRSVDVWSSAWTDETKRAAIEAAPAIHRRKGTRGAVNAAVGVLGYPVDVIEWWQDTPRADPFTFRISVDVTDRGASAAELVQLASAVGASKNLRSHLSSLGLLDHQAAIAAVAVAQSGRVQLVIAAG